MNEREERKNVKKEKGCKTMKRDCMKEKKERKKKGVKEWKGIQWKSRGKERMIWKK